MSARKRNWYPLLGFLLSLLAFVSYFAFFARFPVTRDLPWATGLLFLAALLLGFGGLRRAFKQREVYAGRISASLLAVLTLVVASFFTFYVARLSRHLPSSKGAPQVGQKAPAFTLPDIHNQQVALSDLLTQPLSTQGGPTAPARAVLLVFYRGYW